MPSGVGGLNQDSVILCEQIRVIDKSRIIRIIGHLDDNYMDGLAVALRAILGL
ncbi:MAG: type II toxin-antitoxin system PemK/MazF family toxin [Microcoleus sp.]|uniref:type II toxin-antitoxin system PemK/MazF family toxin n=1 Tax=Microcoleus sp. TaxID=44472 RepID=UPI003C76C416